MITDTIGQHKVLYQFIITVTISEDKKHIEVVAMVVVINSVIGGFGGKDSV